MSHSRLYPQSLLRLFKLALVLEAFVLWQLAAAFPATVVTTTEAEYDYVVVGGGTSGLVVANRLTEDKDVSVLVIEAGPILDGKQEFDELLVGAKFENIDRSRSAYTWPNITSDPIENLKNKSRPILTAMKARRLTCQMIVGGGSAVNGKIFVRGSKRDYDDWARYLNDDGWSWTSLLEYFKKLETFTPPIESYRQQGNITWDMSVHGINGPIQVTFPPQFYPSIKYLVAAEKGLGIPQKIDPDNGDPVGSFWHTASMYPGDYTRSYSKRDHYDPAKARPNLNLIANTTVTRILFEDKTAVGVTYAAGPEAPRQTVRARREVILAGGAIKTPQLLQVSGVGPKNLSAAIGVPSISDIPVGENFHTHGVLTLDYNTSVTVEEKMWADKLNKTFMDEQYAQFITNHTGYYTTTSTHHMMLLSVPILHGDGAEELLAHFRAQDPKQYLQPGIDNASADAYKRQSDILLASMATNETGVDENYTSGKASVLVKPLSRGFVRARTGNIWDAPAVNHRTFSHPIDLENVLASLKWSRKLQAAPEMKPLNPIEVSPGLHVQTDEDLREFIRENMSPGGAHMCCSASMGTVLDSKMRVLGVKRLRVVDSSSWPIIPGNHATQSTAYAVAERAADLIKMGF